MSFFKKNKERIIVVIVSLILIIIIGLTSRGRTSLTKLEKGVGNILMPPGKIFTSLGENMSGFFGGFKKKTKLEEENELLKKEIVKLEDENRTYLDIIGKTDYLKKEANLLEKTEFNLIKSQIVGKEPGNWFDLFTIDKGTNDGVKKGDTVIQGVEVDNTTISEGLIGRVVDVGPNWSKVVSIIDELSTISFKILRTQDGGMISGSMESEISGYLFDDKADIIKGDKIYTSGLGGSFVSDLYIGEVDSVIEDDYDMMKKISVKPAIDFKKLYKVYIISNLE